MKEYKPKAIRTLRKMVHDIREHCQHVSASEFFGCHTCPYNVEHEDGFGCWFEWSGFLKPKDWNINEMGTFQKKKL